MEKIMHKFKILTTLILLAMLTGCAYYADTAETANIADTADTSHNRDSVQSEQTTYQESAFPAKVVYGSYTCEIRNSGVDPYAVITGVSLKPWQVFNLGRPWLTIPETIHGDWGVIPVKEVGSYALANMGLESVEIPATVERIGEGAFRGNAGLSEVLFCNSSCALGEDVFAGCGDPLYVYYEEVPEESENLVKNYAEENGFLTVENIPFTKIVKEPIVHYYEEPIHLTPRVEDFFYGEYADDENFLSMEYAEDATDFGWGKWHAPCGEFCVGWTESDITASSTLASSDDRYAVSHLLRLTRNDFMDDGVAWAEGVEGPGIGEYITYDTRKSWLFSGVEDLWDVRGRGYDEYFDRDENDYPTDSYGYPIDGYMRYLEVCVVNGYAKNEKTWEENGRVRTLLMYVEDRPYAYLELEDILKPQYFELPEGDILAADGGEISFRFEIVDVYPGTKYDDTCLTGLALEFSGRFGH